MLKDRLQLYKEIENERNSKLLVFITGDRPNFETQISSEMQDYFVNHLDKFNLPDKISLFLYTRGGDTMAAWSLINLIKQFCKSYEVIVVAKARSAGTLISLGVNKIIMTKQATLGPIDPSLNSPLNPQNPAFPQNPHARVPVSVESINSTVLVNYETSDTSVTDNVYQTPTEHTDNLSFALKNDIIIDYSLAEIEVSDVNENLQPKILKE